MRFMLFAFLAILSAAPTMALGSYEVVEKRYADPFSVDIGGMPSLDNLPVDDPSDGIDWLKVPLPEPCVSGVGKETFIMVRRGSSNNLLIFFEGGGACADYKTCRPLFCTNFNTCKPLFGMGSVVTLESKFRFLSLYYRGGIFDVEREDNPFRNWTIVFVPYNTGDLHMGNRVVRYISKGDSKTIYHVGYVNAVVAMRWAKENGNFEKVAVAGSSAGGYATLLHGYMAWRIFGKPVTVINDAGPGIDPDSDSKFQLNEILERWGCLQNFPSEALPYFEGKDPVYVVKYLLDSCSNCLYGFFEDQEDLVIGSIFSAYWPWEFRARLLEVTDEIRSYSDRYCRFLPYGYQHTALTGGLFYPLQRDRFYSERVNDYTVNEWVRELLRGNCLDLVE